MTIAGVYHAQTIAAETAEAFGKKCDAIYEGMVRRLKTKKDPESILEWISMTAGFAWMFHGGRFADGRIENPALEIGAKLEESQPNGDEVLLAGAQRASNHNKKRSIHVATTLYGVGGHSRLINSWIHNDSATEHSLLLTDQMGEIPEWMTETILQSGGELITLRDRSLLSKAMTLRKVARQFDFVVLHHHPNDVTPIVAFANEAAPPVAILNHADHVFWLGSSVADVILNVRGFGARITQTRRFAQKSLMLPLPLMIPSVSVTKAEARARLNIPSDAIVLLSIGTRYKFTPTATHDFFATTDRILTENPAAHLYIIGIPPAQSHEHLRREQTDRLHFLGTVEDPTLFRLAADIYLDSMPYGSLTALLETAALGVCPVLMYAPPAPQYDMSEQLVLSGTIVCTATEEEYVKHVNHLIRHPETRRELADTVKENILSYHEGEEWRTCLARIYKFLETTNHQCAGIPSGEFQETPDDQAIFDFNAFRYRGTSTIRQTVERNFDILTLRDMLSLFLLSLRLRDIKFSYEDMRIWLQMFRSKLLR